MSPSPFKTIWISPRATVRRIVAENPRLHVVLLACLSGVGESLNRASRRNAGDRFSITVILGLACVLGPLGGLLTLWISSHLLSFTGKLVGGRGNREHLKTAIAWATVPVVFALPLWIPNLLLFGSEMFTSRTPRLDSQPALVVPFMAITLAQLILSIWSVVLLCQTVTEVQGYSSAWRGVANVLLAAGLIVVALILLLILITVVQVMVTSLL